jgi:drug/metabolite transporter (DMT)-like permease
MSPVLRAAGWMMVVLFSLVMLAVSAREMSAEMSTIHILFLRSVVSLGLILVFVTRVGPRQLRTSQPGLHFSRNLAHLVAQYAWIYGIASISLAQVIALEFTTPIWTTVIAIIILGESLNRYRVMSLVLGMAGVLIIVRPGVADIHPATLVVLFSAVCFALAHIQTKQIVVKDSPVCVIFYMTLIHLLLSCVPALWTWEWPSASMWPWICTMAVVSITAHFSMAKAFALADAMVVVPMDFLRLPLAALVGYLVYAESMEFLVLVGAAIMFSGNLINIVAERRRVNDAI